MRIGAFTGRSRSQGGFLGDLQLLLRELAAVGDACRVGRPGVSRRLWLQLARSVGSFAAGALEHEYELVAEELFVCELVARVASRGGGQLCEADRLQLEQSIDRLESFLAVERVSDLTATPPAIMPVRVAS